MSSSVVVCDIGLVKQEQWSLAIVEYILLRFRVVDVLEEVEVGLVTTAKLLVERLYLAHFSQTLFLQDGSRLDCASIHCL